MKAHAISLLVHALVILAILNVNDTVPARSPSEYSQKIAGKDTKLVWYKFRKELPAVKPAERQPEDRPLRAAVKAPQSIVASAKDAPKRSQMVWTPAPELAPAPLLDSPNIIAVKLPPKQLPQPTAPTRPGVAKARFIADTPALEASLAPALPVPDVRLPPKLYIAPPPPRITIPRTIAAVDAPAPAESSYAPAGTAPLPSRKLPPRPFTAPPASGAATSSPKGTAIDSTPAPDLPADSRDLNVAIVGLNPLDRMVPPPPASSRANFSAGPQPRPDGAASAGAAGGLSLPDLFVQGAKSNKPDLLAEAYAPPGSPAALRAAIRDAGPVMTVHVDPSVPAHQNAARVSGAPDPRFNGREVYMMAIQMPNLTSYSGSWLMWYSGRTARDAGMAPIAAPVPHRKVDPKYVATAVEERIEGTVRLACLIDREGRVSDVELVRGLDDRLNESARTALAKWEFYPATKGGVPVEVDVLVEIPFRLAPKAPGR